MMDGTVLMYAVGDVGPCRNNPEYPYKQPIFELSAPTTREGDIVFCQLERILSDKPTRAFYDNEVVHPDNVKQLTYAGFNVVSFAGNHHMDAGADAFVDTLEVLNRNGIKPVGVGMNIAQARQPVIMDKKGTKVAFLAYSSVLPKSGISYDAEDNRPGCVPMFVSTWYEASDWQPGMPSPKVISVPRESDVEAMRNDVARAKAMADVVVMSIHWGVHFVPGFVAMYQYQVAHAAVDAGVDLILGHHPHILKAIEVYKGKTIFYSLGNFAMDSTIPRRIKGSWDVVFRPQPDADYPTYRGTPDSRNTMIVKCLISDNGIRKLSFLPCLINKLGQPEPLLGDDARSQQVLNYVKWCCQDQKLETRFVQEGNDVLVCT